MRFIHAADLHLDSPMQGLASRADAPTNVLRTATRGAFVRLVDAALRLEVDFMVIAGDIYDGDWQDFNTGIFFALQLGRLDKAHIPVFLLHGNHDAQSSITRSLRLPANVHRFPAERPETFELESLGVALHGQSFAHRAVTENLAASYPRPRAGCVNIGVLHTALEGHSAHARYAPCTADELDALGYDYWALGHVHERRVIARRSTIAYPGNLQGRHIREPGARGALLVEIDGRGAVDIAPLEVDVLRWHTLTVDVSAAHDFDAAAGAACEALAEHAQACGPDHLQAVRLVLQGNTRAHGELFGLDEQLRAEIARQAAAVGADRLWIEQVRIATGAPRRLGGEQSAMLGDLHALLAEAATDPGLQAELRADLLKIVGSLPREVAERAETLDAIRHGRIDEVLADIAPRVAAMLAQDD